MTTPADFVPLLTSDLRKLSAGQWREGDVVFFYAPSKNEAPAQAGYTVLASATEHYTFDPYTGDAKPRASALPQNVQLWYHATVAIDPKDLHVEDALSLLWSHHRKAVAGKDDLLIEHEVPTFSEGEVLLQERLDGYLSLDVHGQERSYPAAKSIKKRRFLPAKKQKLIQRPFTQRNLLRIVATDPKRISFFSR